MMLRSTLACLYGCLLVLVADAYRLTNVLVKPVRRLHMATRRNESGARSFYSPSFYDDEPGPEQQWRSQMKDGIIPTGPDSLARIEHKVNQNVNVKVLEAANNAEAAKYFRMIESLEPNDMLLKFAKSAPKHMQEAAKSTILNMLGNLPNYALDAALITTNTKLANLLYQMQMTGYMFKNAEYRMSLTKMLKGLPRLPPRSSLGTTVANYTLTLPLEAGTRVQGEVTVRSPSGQSTTVDVEQLTSALSKEIAELRTELMLVRSERENELRANLLTFIQALPEHELVRLTADMSTDVVQAIEMLVDALMDRLAIPSREKEVVVQQSVGQLAQLCMWQMVVGYKLRELEALEKGNVGG